MNKQTKQKIVLWEGFKKELPWIIFWLLIGLMIYGYYQDKQICEEVLSDPCKVCYSLNQTSIDFEYYNGPVSGKYQNITINDSLIPPEDTDINSRTIINYNQTYGHQN